jgi:ubiquitin carboxyl-terminal hydrolase 5/13
MKDIKAEKKEVTEKKEITKLAIGIEGGFNSGHGKIEYETLYSLIGIDPINIVEPLNLNKYDEDFPQILQFCITTIIETTSASKKEDEIRWEGEEIRPSKYCDNLTQLEFKEKIPLEGWSCYCEGCEFKDNLWLCLSCGVIGCGRRYYDGTGANNHGVKKKLKKGGTL